MKRKIPIPGEKAAMRKALEDAKDKYGSLTRNQIIRIKKHVHKKMVRKAWLGATGFLSIAAIFGGVKVLTSGDDKTPTETHERSTEYIVEPESKDGHESFTERYHVETAKSIEDQIKNLSDKDELLDYIKEQYIEARNEKIGQDDLSADDIKIISNYENILFQNPETGELITHGDNPEQTQENLRNQGINVIGFGDNERVYKVQTNEGKIIDCITMQNIDGKSTPIKVMDGNNYQNYESVLAEMGDVIPTGIELYTHFDDKPEYREVEEQNFIKAIKDWKGIKETNIAEQQQGVQWANDGKQQEDGLEI